MPRLALVFRRLFPPVLAGILLLLAGCADHDRLSYAAEVDEPNYREGQSLLKSGRRQEALTSFLKVIDKRGDDAPESHLSVGLIYAEHMNDPLSAIYHYRKYLALRPNSPLSSQVKQRIDAATREFARTLPAQPLEAQLQRVDLVAALDRLKRENDTLKQELADLKASRNIPAAPADAPGDAVEGVNFSVDPGAIPTVRTRPLPPSAAPPRLAAPTRPGAAATPPSPAVADSRATAPRRHVVQPGDTLSKIALQYYNNRAKWRDIYAANRGVMKHESDLKVGMELRLP
ncbi:MAG: LysM peptidoglycan-binding domain-containing protein [Opitutaceae bacterium]|nr:LysM peptidoglycan-binding domain-containing protein [Opitutaceae bacterium]